MPFHLKSRFGRVAAAVTVSAIGAAGVFAGLASTTATAGADPKQLDALVGVGSDTTQEVMNALAGENAGHLFTPIRSSAASGYRQIASFNAMNPDVTGDQCITPKVKFATIYRANGSGSGAKALSRSIDMAATWGNGQTACSSTGKSVAGLIDFARSSSSGSGTGTDLTYVPFARDALSYAYYFSGQVGATAITDFTKAELNAIYTSNADYTDIVRGSQTTRVYACDIQSGSGTGNTWATDLGYTRNTSANTAAYTVCMNTGGNPSNQTGTNTGKLQENDTAALKVKGEALAALAGNSGLNVQAIVGMSAANFIARANLVSFETIASGVNMGAIANDGTTNLGFPFGDGTAAWNGSSSSLTPNATFFQSSTFGRSVYNVFDSNRITDPDIASLFIGGTSAICADSNALSTISTYGFAPLASGCGSTSLTRPLSSGTA